MTASLRALVAIPVFNEARHVPDVLQRTLALHPHVLVIDDGSTDQTPALAAQFPVEVVRHARNRGYGASMISAFRFAIAHGYDWLITMDCDEQHEPASIPRFVREAALDDADVISGSRYTREGAPNAGNVGAAPADRRAINRVITREVNERFEGLLGRGPGVGGPLTDAFCGFKAYRVRALRGLRPSETGYAFPMQFWAQAAALRLRVRELPVRLIYNDPSRTFGPELSDPAARLAHYRRVLHEEVARQRGFLPAHALRGIDPALLATTPEASTPHARLGDAHDAALSPQESTIPASLHAQPRVSISDDDLDLCPLDIALHEHGDASWHNADHSAHTPRA